MSNVAGYFRGRPACSCQLAWLPVYEAELLRRGLLKSNLDVFQLIGGAPQSAGVHASGGANDTAQMSTAQLTVSRNMGCADSPRHEWQGFDDPHAHGVLKGCPHAARSAKAQIAEIDGGGDGLVGTRADIGPRKGVKWPLRPWKAGIKWAAAEVLTDKKRTVKHAARRYVVKGGKLAGRSYPSVGPVLVRRPKGFKIAATATYTAPDGSKHVRTKYGTWYALAYLTAVKPAATKPKPVPAPMPTTGKVVTHTNRPKLGAHVADVMTWNLGILNLIGKARWLKNRRSVAKVIVANKLDVLFLQEAPAGPAKWLAEATGMRRVGGQARPIFLRKGVEVLGWQIWTPPAKAKGGKDKPVTFARVILNGVETLLVNCHPQAEQKYTVLRGTWAEQVIDEAERRSKARGGIPIVFAGDFQGGEFARQAKSQGRPYRRSLETAHRVINGTLRSFNRWSSKPTDGYQMDQVTSDLVAEEHRLIHNDRLADHNRVRVSLHLPA